MSNVYRVHRIYEIRGDISYNIHSFTLRAFLLRFLLDAEGKFKWYSRNILMVWMLGERLEAS